ncbi:MAG: MFS transporter [Candidatus Dormibacteraeota bacterium]|nr:MFS transporter [Candidatus Dormibacteraeota bacterium]
MITPFQSLRPRSVNRPVLLALTGAGLFIASLDAYVVVTAILPMLTSVHIPINHLERATPIITGFLLGYLAVMPLAGGLSDRFGRLRVFVVCLVLFAIGSLVTATAGNLSQLVTGRLLQGAGGGALVPIVLALAADLYPSGARSPVLGGVSALQEIGSVLGPLWGGLIAASLGWNWIFWLNLPLALLLIWALWPDVTAMREARRATHVDWLGAALAAAALALLTLALYAADPEKSPVGSNFLWQAPLAILLFVLFAWHERRTAHPLLEVRYFRDSSFSGGAITNAIAGAGLMVALVYIPVLAESPIVFSMNPRQAALLLFRLMLGIPIGALLGGWLAHRLRSYRVVAAAGMLVAAAGFLLLAGWSERSLDAHLLGLPLRLADAELFLTGLGLGLEIAPVSAAVLDAVGETQRGAGASVLIVMRLIGMLVGFSLVAGYGLYEFHQATAHLLPPIPTLLPDFAVRYATYVLHLRQALLGEYHLIFQATAIALVVGALIAAVTLRPVRRPRWR